MLDTIYYWLVNHMEAMETAICFMAALTALWANVLLIRERRRKR